MHSLLLWLTSSQAPELILFSTRHEYNEVFMEHIFTVWDSLSLIRGTLKDST